MERCQTCTEVNDTVVYAAAQNNNLPAICRWVPRFAARAFYSPESPTCRDRYCEYGGSRTNLCIHSHIFLVAKVGEGEPGHPHPDPVFQVDTRFTCVRRHSMPSVEKVLDLKRVSGLRQMFRWRSHHNRSRLNLRGL